VVLTLRTASVDCVASTALLAELTPTFVWFCDDPDALRFTVELDFGNCTAPAASCDKAADICLGSPAADDCETNAEIVEARSGFATGSICRSNRGSKLARRGTSWEAITAMLSMLLRAATIESKDTGGLPGAGVEDASNVENWDAKDVDEHELLSTVSEALDGSVFEASETDVVAAASDTLV